MKIYIALITLLAVSAAHAQTAFPARYETNGVALELKGTARMKMGGLISLYDIALYLPAETAPDRVLDDVPKRLDIAYLKTLSRNVLIENAGKGLASNEPPARLEQLQARIDQINQAYQAAKPRDRYALTYLPGKGTDLSLNGASQVVIPGADFAAAYYSIWLGTNCPRPEVRDALLGRAKK